MVVWRNTWLSGSETFVRDQVAAMRRWQPVTLGLRASDDPLTTSDLTVLGSSRASELRVEVLGSLGLRRRLTGFVRDARLVHAHFGLDATCARPVAAAAGIPLVATCHGYDVTLLPSRRGPAGAEYRRRLRRTFRDCAALVAVSSFVAERMVALGASRERVRVLPIGIDTSRALPPVAERRGVTFVGRLVPKKGLADLMRAWAALPAALRAEHPLRVVGAGPERDTVERLAAGVDGTVELPGTLPSSQVAALLARSAVYAQPSRTAPDGDAEGFGMVFLEAALQGVPSVAYAHGGVPDAVVDGETGLLAPEGDVAALSAHLEQLLTDPDLAARLGHAGRERVLASFDVNACTARLEELYDSVVSPRS